MRIKNIFLLTPLLLLSCGSDTTPAPSVAPRTAVTLTHAVRGSITEETSYPATATYLHKSVLTAPIAGYVIDATATVGQHVAAGQTLYRIESREQHALQADATDVAHSQAQALTAVRSGIVIDVAALAGNYVSEGQSLCTIADAASLVFEISVPIEQAALTKRGSTCTLLLPDGTRLRAVIGTPLATMDATSQTLTVVAHVTGSASVSPISEGLRAQALLTLHNSSSTAGNALLLPRTAVQSNESLTEHWVMKLRDDSTAVRVPVTIGRNNGERVEVFVTPATALTIADRVILTGGYGLEDGAKVSY